MPSMVGQDSDSNTPDPNEVCVCGHPAADHTHFGSGDCSPVRASCGCDRFRPAVSPTPAEAQQGDVTGAGLMRNRCAFTSRDMAADWPEAFTYAVVLGWGDGNEDEDDAWTSMAAKFGWDAELLAFLYDAHRRFSGLADRAEAAALAAQPSEPPVPGQPGLSWPDLPIADRPIGMRVPPAETQQDEERLTAYTCPRWHRDPDGWCVDERPHLAARPSADTEKLLQRVRELADKWEAEADRADDAEPVNSDGLTRMILAARYLRMSAADLRAALGGDA